MTCAELERLLDRGEPDEQTRQEMQRHAETCESCRLLLELRALDRDEAVPEEASTRWKAALRTEKAKAEAQRRTGFWNSRAFAPVMAAAALLIAVVALRQPIANLQKPQPAPLSMMAASTEAPAQDMAPAPQLSMAAPKMAAVATNAPLTLGMNSASPEAAPEEPEEADAAPMLSAGAMLYQANEEAEEAAMETADASAFMQDTLEADSQTLTWTADAPSEAAEQLLRAMGWTDSIPEENESGVSLSLSVRREDLPALLEALEKAGCTSLPTEDELPWDQDGQCRLDLLIEKGGTNP